MPLKALTYRKSKKGPRNRAFLGLFRAFYGLLGPFWPCIFGMISVQFKTNIKNLFKTIISM